MNRAGLLLRLVLLSLKPPSLAFNIFPLSIFSFFESVLPQRLVTRTTHLSSSEFPRRSCCHLRDEHKEQLSQTGWCGEDSSPEACVGPPLRAQETLEGGCSAMPAGGALRPQVVPTGTTTHSLSAQPGMQAAQPRSMDVLD